MSRAKTPASGFTLRAESDPDGKGVTRRQLLGAAGGLLAVAKLTGSAAFTPGDTVVHAQARPAAGRRPQRVVVVGVDHYHATSTPNYLRLLQGQKVDIVGIHAPDDAVASKWAASVQQRGVHGLSGNDRQDQARVRCGAWPPRSDAGGVPLPRRDRNTVPHGETLGCRRPHRYRNSPNSPNPEKRGRQYQCRSATACSRKP